MVKMLVATCKTDTGKLACIEIQKNGYSKFFKGSRKSRNICIKF